MHLWQPSSFVIAVYARVYAAINSTWGSHVHLTYSVHWLGSSIAIRLPVCPSSGLRAVNWIVDETRWRQIVENGPCV